MWRMNENVIYARKQKYTCVHQIIAIEMIRATKDYACKTEIIACASKKRDNNANTAVNVSCVLCVLHHHPWGGLRRNKLRSSHSNRWLNVSIKVVYFYGYDRNTLNTYLFVRGLPMCIVCLVHHAVKISFCIGYFNRKSCSSATFRRNFVQAPKFIAILI